MALHDLAPHLDRGIPVSIRIGHTTFVPGVHLDVVIEAIRLIIYNADNPKGFKITSEVQDEG